MASWSRGQDAALSRRKQGFDSPTGCEGLLLTSDSLFVFIVIVCERSEHKIGKLTIDGNENSVYNI